MTRITFNSSVHAVQAEKRQAVFYLLNTTPNLNRWGVTDKALEEALLTIIRKPIGCGPEYRIDHHYPDPVRLGQFTRGEKPNGYALGTAEITDDHAWQKLVEGEWGPISVVIISYMERCSSCHTDLTKEPDPFNHPCITRGEAFLEIQSFVFDRVDFVDVPAYPQAGFINQAEARTSIPLELLANLYHGEESTDQRGINDKKYQEMKEKMELDKLEQLVTNLEKELAELEKEITEERTAKDEVTEELGELQAKLQEEAIKEILQARTKAGLVNDPEKELLTLSDYAAEVLDLLRSDAEKIIAQQSQPNNPKAKNQFTEQTELEAAMDETRLRLFGYRREHK